ncbi:ABC transporter permease [Mesorhizobium sp. WSM4312]|uniref:carbohydrate ABC transporter permease n=1 Tax=Mesorhizobium sp. WSM4312 TaxID=2029411 RepID=UPI000BAED584|nr:carbohydrate ABC transporter permease [Mesorhizobium sp. WSM4312]PBB64730.1 ABC transporter permease [Mesorhizobium sp. WSM4312]
MPTNAYQDPIPPFPSTEPLRVNHWSLTKVISNVTLLVIGAFFLLPMLWLFAASVDSSASWQLKLPVFTMHNYALALQPDYTRALLNSLILSLIATIVATVAAFMAAYSFSRQHIPWKGPILLAILFLSGVPISILIVPIYKMFTYVGWLSILPTAILLGVTALPFEIYLIKNAIDAIPLDLEEAASIEKASIWKILRRIVIPLTMPGIASAAIFGFVNAWGNFLIPLVLITRAAEQPGPVRMYGFMNSVAINYGAVAAFSILYSLPVVILYLLMSRSFRAGFVLGGAVR